MSTVEPVGRSPLPRSNAQTFIAGNLLLVATAFGASPQSSQLLQDMKILEAHYSFPASCVRDRRRERFKSLAQKWRADTRWTSSTTDIAMHPAYQAIIGMGDEALPLILEELRDSSGYWYWALKAISNEDPVPPPDRGAIKRMKSTWLRWGEAKGLIAK